MRTHVQHKDRRTWITQVQSDTSESITHISAKPPRDLDVETWDKTDRQLRFPTWHHPIRLGIERLSTQDGSNDSARARWLEENDVHTQFFDAGIGCCWFAQMGDQEPVSGETEEEAIARLARQNGFELWSSA